MCTFREAFQSMREDLIIWRQLSSPKVWGQGMKVAFLPLLLKTYFRSLRDLRNMTSSET